MREVAVVVAAFNAESTVVQAVESVLFGTMPCHVYVVDDYSRIPVESCLRHLADRITILRLDENRGPAAARNVALKLVLKAGFKYVAIMDADDIAWPDRLKKQHVFMESHPRVGALGGWTREFYQDISENHPPYLRPTEPDGVRKLMYFNIGISHATMMLRVEALKEIGLYSVAYPVAEDYELLRRIAGRYEVANLPEFLVYYRISPNGQSRRRHRRQLADRLAIQLKYFEFRQWRAWAGLAQTMLILALPNRIFYAIKLRLLRRL